MTRGTPLFTLDARHNVVVCDDTLEWADWMTHHVSELVLANSQVGTLSLSTVFLGVSVRAAETGRACELFESLIIGDDSTHPLDHARWRYDTWAEAIAGHSQHLAELIQESHR